MGVLGVSLDKESLGMDPKNDGERKRHAHRIPGTFSCLHGAMEFSITGTPKPCSKLTPVNTATSLLILMCITPYCQNELPRNVYECPNVLFASPSLRRDVK
ncbi:uncharacterized protein CLUP02_10677 [Colletotrichum lupini]|uniref:Uncharacterized protein n=1 Tax=Colletotrichum lupini TaxID=145971 RepID=A0A9Q8SYT0_9PEZI|nr:uncharacterized protein CLUP02_10677 [Colletotrichum lupini]UQC85181.1 hypothetical protein CLUP02_10677 [Colletotrichum lupini]